MRFNQAYFITCVTISILFISCKKNHTDNIGSNVKIEFVAGNNQSDTTGRILKDSLQFRVTRDGVPLPGAHLYVTLPACSYTSAGPFRANDHGMAYFPWKLNSTVGRQELKMYVTDSLDRNLDSVTATATGLYFDHGWLPGDCLPDNRIIDLHALSTGRILGCKDNVMYYSDNNGISWQVLRIFPQPGNILVANYGLNIFAYSGNYLLHSVDNGATWTSLQNIVDSAGGSISYLFIARSGNVFIINDANLFMSTDLLKTVVKKSLLPYGGIISGFCEAPDGTLLLIDEYNLYVSHDTGTTWTESYPMGFVNSLFSDDNGDIYMSISGAEGDLYRLSGFGAGSFQLNLVTSFPPMPGTDAGITRMTKVNNKYYFMLDGYGLMRTDDFTSFQNIKSGDIYSYCVTTSNSAVVCDPFLQMFYTNNSIQVEYNINP